MPNKKPLTVAIGLPLVLLVTALVYWPGLNGPFLFDDDQNIITSYVSSFDFDQIYYEITHNTSGTYGRPISVLSLVLTGILHGPEAWGYKFHNLVIHLITGLLIFWFLYKILPRLAASQTPEKNLLICGLVTSIWLLHPLQVSTVLYAVQRMAQLTSLFTLAALLVYVYAREAAGDSGSRFYWLAYLALPVCTLLSLLSKENGVLIPLHIFALEFLVFRFEYPTGQAQKRLYWFLGLFVVTPVVTGALYLFTHLDSFINYSARDFTMSERLMTELHVVPVYLKMILLPRLSDMTLFHDYFKVIRSFDLGTALLLLCLCLSIFLVFFLWKKLPVLSFAIAWFLVCHGLESTFFSLELMFEHRNYIAAVGPLLALVYFLFNMPVQIKVQYLSGVFLLLVVYLTFMRVQEWTSEEMIYQVAIAEHPDSTRVQAEMANVKYSLGDVTGALNHLAMAQANSPRDFGPELHGIVFRCTSGTDIQPLLDRAVMLAERYPATTYSVSAINNLLVLLNNNSCPEFNADQLLSVIEAAERQPGNQGNTMLFGVLRQIKGQLYLSLKADYARGIQFALESYDMTGMTSVLGDLVKNLIQLQLLGDAEYIIQVLEDINREKGGRETALIRPLQARLDEARQLQNLAGQELETVLDQELEQ